MLLRSQEFDYALAEVDTDVGDIEALRKYAQLIGQFNIDDWLVDNAFGMQSDRPSAQDSRSVPDTSDVILDSQPTIPEMTLGTRVPCSYYANRPFQKYCKVLLSTTIPLPVALM